MTQVQTNAPVETGSNGVTPTAIESSTASETPSADGKSESDPWEALWAKLHASGWTSWEGSGKAMYFRAGITPGSGTHKLDFFRSKEEVMHFCRINGILPAQEGRKVENKGEDKREATMEMTKTAP